MKTVNLSQLAILIFVFQTISVSGQATLLIFDGTKNAATAEKINPAIENFVRQNALPKVKKLISADACEEKLNVVGTAQGAFTKKGARQTAVLYEYCQTGNGFALDGIAVLENQKIVAHYFYNGAWNLSLKSLPDINRNGFDEMLIEASGGMHQGFYGSGVDILEFSARGIREIGGAQASTNECGTGERGEECPKAYRISVKTGNAPIFYREKFNEISGNKYRKASAPTKFSLSKLDYKFEAVK